MTAAVNCTKANYRRREKYECHFKDRMDASWNPVRGCTKISPGCAHCYAETFAERFRGVPGHAYEQGFDLRLVPEKLAEPLRWSRPKMVFVNSISDLFHEGVPDDYIAAFARVVGAQNRQCRRRARDGCGRCRGCRRR